MPPWRAWDMHDNSLKCKLGTYVSQFGRVRGYWISTFREARDTCPLLILRSKQQNIGICAGNVV